MPDEVNRRTIPNIYPETFANRIFPEDATYQEVAKPVSSKMGVLA